MLIIEWNGGPGYVNYKLRADAASYFYHPILRRKEPKALCISTYVD